MAMLKLFLARNLFFAETCSHVAEAGHFYSCLFSFLLSSSFSCLPFFFVYSDGLYHSSLSFFFFHFSSAMAVYISYIASCALGSFMKDNSTFCVMYVCLDGERSIPAALPHLPPSSPPIFPVPSLWFADPDERSVYPLVEIYMLFGYSSPFSPPAPHIFCLNYRQGFELVLDLLDDACQGLLEKCRKGTA